jgi:hypothetical protein
MNAVPESDTNRPRQITDYVNDGVFNPDWQSVPRR